MTENITKSEKIICLAIVLILQFSIPRTTEADFTVDISTETEFKQNGRWRVYANLTIRNICEVNITIQWVSIDLVNITLVDESFEDLSDLRGFNFTMDPPLRLQPGYAITLPPINATAFGFELKPKVMWVELRSSYLEAKVPLIVVLPLVPEYPSLWILTLFTITSLTVVLKRSHMRTKEQKEKGEEYCRAMKEKKE